MKKYILKRFAIAIVTVLIILFILFLMLDLMPGSPFNDEKMSKQQIAALYAQYGLDKPLFIRYFTYLAHMLTLNFGVSYNIQVDMPISEIIANRFPVSIQIGLQAAVLGTFVGLILGIVAALRRNTIVDRTATIISVLGVSLPSFVFALALSYFFGFQFKLLPMLYSSSEAFTSTVLPTIALSMFTIACIARYTRSELIEVLASDYILLVDAKGVPKIKLITFHALRNALIGVITVLAPLIVNLMTGSLVVEKIFSIPGLGSLFINAIEANDYNVVLTISFIYSVLFIGVMLLVDVLYVVIDPRVRLTEKE